MHLPTVKQILTSWTIRNRLIPQDWEDMARAILQPATHFQWFSWWREEARKIAWQNREISTDQLLCWGRGAGCIWWRNSGIVLIISLKGFWQSHSIREKTWTIYSSHTRSTRNLPWLFTKANLSCGKEYIRFSSKKGNDWIFSLWKCKCWMQGSNQTTEGRVSINRWVD